MEKDVRTHDVHQQEGMLMHGIRASRESAHFRDVVLSLARLGPPGGFGRSAPQFEQVTAPSPLSFPQKGHVPRASEGTGFPSHFPQETQTAHMGNLLPQNRQTRQGQGPYTDTAPCLSYSPKQ